MSYPSYHCKLSFPTWTPFQPNQSVLWSSEMSYIISSCPQLCLLDGLLPLLMTTLETAKTFSQKWMSPQNRPGPFPQGQAENLPMPWTVSFTYGVNRNRDLEQWQRISFWSVQFGNRCQPAFKITRSLVSGICLVLFMEKIRVTFLSFKSPSLWLCEEICFLFNKYLNDHHKLNRCCCYK